MIAAVTFAVMAAFSLSAANVKLGDEQFSMYLPELSGKRVAVFSNQSGIVGDKVLKGRGPDLNAPKVYGPHLVDVLKNRKHVNVTVIFSPEHGFRGNADAGAKVGDSIDGATGIKIVSLYGAPGRPNSEDIDLFDVLLVDIQDVGLRYYTYYVTMYRLMNICAESGKKVIVLDRPNPNGFYVDGPGHEIQVRRGRASDTGRAWNDIG